MILEFESPWSHSLSLYSCTVDVLSKRIGLEQHEDEETTEFSSSPPQLLIVLIKADYFKVCLKETFA